MKRSKHTGEPGNCPACITAAETVRNPWQPSYHDVLASGAGDAIKHAHKAAVRRHERDQAMRDLGLTKVKGSMGGTFWE